METDKRIVAEQRIRTIFDEQLLNHLHRNRKFHFTFPRNRARIAENLSDASSSFDV